MKKQTDIELAIDTEGEKLAEATSRLQLVEVELHNLCEVQTEPNGQTERVLLTI